MLRKLFSMFRSGSKSAPSPAHGMPEEDVPRALPRLPHHPQYETFRSGLSIPVDVLFRTGGRGTHEWFEVKVTRLCGELGKNDWPLTRQFGIIGEIGTRERFLDLDQIIVMQDPRTGREFRDIPEMARFLRLSAGGLTSRDIEELPQWQEEQRRAAFIKNWQAEHGNRRTRKVDPPLAARVICTTDPPTIYEIQIAEVVAHGKTPWVIVGDAKKLGTHSKSKRMTFTLPGYFAPGLEIVSLTPEGMSAPVVDPAVWLDTITVKSRRPKSRAQGI